MVRRKSFRDILASSREKRRRNAVQADDEGYISKLKNALKKDNSSSSSRKRPLSSTYSASHKTKRILGKRTNTTEPPKPQKDTLERIPIGFAEDSQIQDSIKTVSDWICLECGTNNFSWRLLCICCKKCKVFQKIEEKAKLKVEKKCPPTNPKVDGEFYGPFLPWQRPKKKNSQSQTLLPLDASNLTKFKTAKELDAKLSGELFESRVDLDDVKKLEDLKMLGIGQLVKELKSVGLRTTGSIDDLAARVFALKKNGGTKGLSKKFFPVSESKTQVCKQGTMAFLERAKTVREIDWMSREPVS